MLMWWRSWDFNCAMASSGIDGEWLEWLRFVGLQPG
jgi:hypothetical protein